MRIKQLSLPAVFYILSMVLITASVLLFINDFRERSNLIVDLTNQKNSLNNLKARQSDIQAKMFKLIYFKDESLTSEILSATEDYEFILNDFINIAYKHHRITDISLYTEVTASFAQLRELIYQIVRRIKEKKIATAINQFQGEYVQRENILTLFITEAQYGKEQQIKESNKKNNEHEKLFTIIFTIEILLTLVITYLINHRVNTKLSQSKRRLNILASHDSLTGLYNRRLFLEHLNHALELAKRNNEQFAMFFLDLDGFKLINDTVGHYIGDKVLVEVAERIRECVRASDTVYRLGGDEFTIILEHLNDLECYKIVVKKVLQSIRKPYYIEGKNLFLSASIGVSIYPEHGLTIDSLVNSADAAMYRVKAEGKNNYLCFSIEMLSESNHRTQLKNDMQNAVSNDELFLLYQPKIDLATGKLAGCEALVRWQHPTMGIISPLEFIPLAEETGLIMEIGLWVLESASAQIENWRRRNISIPQVAINLSGSQLERPETLHKFLTILAENPFPSSMLEFELTESVIMGYQASDAHHILSLLQTNGHMVSIDDFGTGYSSLSHLKHLPVNTLKIDRSFIADVLQNEEDKSIVKSILALAKNLGLKTVAEGVETKEQLDFLKEHGCELVQGYYFAKPLSIEDIEAFVEKQH
ncbi:MAG: hypothetical protein DRQ43_01330 [Gammaproteobacteria bacterium]|nr:MAG: hypothetical protein DRQ43_01330 [Gammaproteobacteria bacterium]